MVDVLGSGGMATVYLATNPAGDRVALKVMDPASVLPEETGRFEREFRALAGLHHPNVVRVFGTGQTSGPDTDEQSWIAMEYVDGSDLETLIERWRRHPPPDRFSQIERVFRDLCDGLAAVHDRGLIHRDLKPSNVLVASNGTAKLSDFGVVKDATALTQLTVAGRLVGTVAYMAPEIIMGEPADHRVDLYGLGAVLYHMLAFQRPIHGDSVAAYLARHLTEVPPPPSEVVQGIPIRLERVCMRLLAKEPSQRFVNAAAVIRALEGDEETDSVPLQGRDDQLLTWRHRLTDLKEGAGGALVVHGTPGTGRTELLSRMLDTAEQNGLIVAQLRIVDGQPALEVRTEGPRSPIQRQSGWPQILRLEHAEGYADQLRGQPIVLAVDDLDEAPPPVVRRLSSLLRQYVTLEGEPVLLLFSTKHLEGIVQDLVLGIESGVPADQVALKALDRKATIGLLRDRGLSGAASTALGGRLFLECGGVPGDVIEQLQALIDAEWLKMHEGQLVPTRPLSELRTADLPVPGGVGNKWSQALTGAHRAAQRLVQVLALLQRPASPALLGRIDPEIVRPDTLGECLERGLVSRRDVEGEVAIALGHPVLGVHLRSTLTSSEKARLHDIIANGLAPRGRRRRSPSSELATHLEAADRLPEAYEAFIQAARAAHRANLPLDVRRLCERALAIREQAERALPADLVFPLHRQAAHWFGEALFNQGDWEAATGPLSEAVNAAEQATDADAKPGLAQCLSARGRTYYRLDAFEDAAVDLERALTLFDAMAHSRDPAARCLADIRMRQGRLDEAEFLWLQTLARSRATRVADAEARARRGLAHVRALQNRYDEARDEINAADDLLARADNPRVRAGVLARSVELDLVGGRYASARHRVQVLLDLLGNHQLTNRLAEALALNAMTLAMLGQPDEALTEAQRARVYAQTQGHRGNMARILIARALCWVDEFALAADALPKISEVAPSRLNTPQLQVRCLKALIEARSAPEIAAASMREVLAATAPVLSFAGAFIAIDAGMAFERLGQRKDALGVLTRGIKRQPDEGADGLLSELLLLANAIGPDAHRHQRAVQVVTRIQSALPGPMQRTFSARPDIRRLFNQR